MGKAKETSKETKKQPATTPKEKKAAKLATTLIKKSQDVSSINAADKVLLPSEYTVRAEMMVEARQLVGGVEIEVTEDMKVKKK